MARVDPVAEVLGIRASGALLVMAAVEHGLPLSSLDRVVRAVGHRICISDHPPRDPGPAPEVFRDGSGPCRRPPFG